MRSPLVVALICLPAIASSQICEGAPPFARGPFQARANATINRVTSSYVGALGVGTRWGFGQVVGAKRFIRNGTGSSGSIGGRAGLQTRVGPGGGRLFVCPVVAWNRISGPKDYDLYGDGYRFDISETNYSVGLALGVVASTQNDLQVVPMVSLARQHATVEIYDPQVRTTDTSKESVSLLDLGVGLISRGGFAIRPDIIIPLGVRNGSLSYSVSVGVNF